MHSPSMVHWHTNMKINKKKECVREKSTKWFIEVEKSTKWFIEVEKYTKWKKSV